MKINIKKLHRDAQVPEYATSGSAGFDLSFAEETFDLLPQKTYTLGTGLAFEIPEGYELQIRPRSGLSLNTQLRISNAPGTVDADYRGEVKIIFTNTSTYRAFRVSKGDRIAQGVLAPVVQATFELVEELGETERGIKGFGSTGV